MTSDQAKITSHHFLRSHKIEINENLPVIESIDDLAPQSADAIARRCVILSYVVGIGFDANIPKLKEALVQFELFEHASRKEQDLLNRTTHSKQEKIDAAWLVESIQSLGWCVGLVEMDPFHHCDDDLASHFPSPFTDPYPFISNTKGRPFEEIYQQVDLHYRLHWAARDSALKGKKGIVDEGLIRERRKGLDWAIGVEEDWDEISADT